METSKAMLVIISFKGRAQMEEQMSEAADLLQRYSRASDLSCTIGEDFNDRSPSGRAYNAT